MAVFCAARADRRRGLRGERGRGTPAGGGPALEGVEGQVAGCGVPDDQFAVEDQAVGQLAGGRGQIGDPLVGVGF